ncbi:MAG: alkene reductase [Rothia sp. (in: high G+C Gram-positive bacteria)]|uniref:alkene reductase n=1 Tax=Rothia sp. (in: high G+C Gram-positive bacteria) TaxID=1885016 RepID=UPI0026E08598|nr:alkene reductase [Rothia sp. (in: high G+C Gram-positive bacteria)]MDO5749734.1 alkene reductase [Rothia sp. (in: high G+C Gram-positive bacteria)]
MNTLYTPTTAGVLKLKNRLVMAPMTRRRATEHGVPTDAMVRYYADRASAGLIVAEGTYPTITSRGYENQPGLESPEQIKGWSHIANAVHERGGSIVVQLMHAGRLAHPELTEGVHPLAPSAIASGTTTHVPSGKAELPVPREMSIDDIQAAKAEFVQAARNAIEAGLDGIELHGATGYLIHQFLAPNSNTRTDQYGGSPENRARFAIELLEEVSAAIGAERVGLRIAPQFTIQGVAEKDEQDMLATYLPLMAAARRLGIAYVSVITSASEEAVETLREEYNGFFILGGDFITPANKELAERLIAEEKAEAVAIGRLFISNPDLPRRFAENLELTEADGRYFYVGGERGYNDYPTAN